MHKVEYTAYKFYPPQELDFDDYKIIKSKITINPKFRLNPQDNIIKTFGFEFKLIGIGLLSGAIGCISLYFNFPDLLWEIGFIISWIVLIAFVFSFVPSIFTYITYLSDKSDYYDILKNDILKSDNYWDFEPLRKGY